MLFAAQKFTSVVVLRKRYILCTLRVRVCVCVYECKCNNGTVVLKCLRLFG